MKKFFLTAIAFLLMTATVFAADATTILTSDVWIKNKITGEWVQRVITTTWTCATAAATFNSMTFTITNGAETTAYSDGTTSGTIATIEGWYLYQVEIDFNTGATEPTEDSDITIKKNSFDLLAGNGTNQVDNSAERMVFASDGVSSILAPITDTIVIAISGNSVNNAAGTVKLVLVPNN